MKKRVFFPEQRELSRGDAAFVLIKNTRFQHAATTSSRARAARFPGNRQIRASLVHVVQFSRARDEYVIQAGAPCTTPSHALHKYYLKKKKKSSDAGTHDKSRRRCFNQSFSRAWFLCADEALRACLRLVRVSSCFVSGRDVGVKDV